MENLLKTVSQIESFKDVPEPELLWMIDKGDIIEIKEGEYLFQTGSAMFYFYIVLKGKLLIRLQQSDQYRVIGEMNELELGGLLPYSRATHATAEGKVVRDAVIFRLHKSCFSEMIQNHYNLTAALVHEMSSRIRTFTKRQQLNEKMISLGKLSAGLAHELNNPSAAVLRSAQELKKHLGFLPEGFKRVIEIKASPEDVDYVNNILFSKIKNGVCTTMSMMERAELEDDILEWLEDNAIYESNEIAETFAEFEFEVEDLELVQSKLRPQDLYPVVNWLSQVLTTEKFVTEIEEASDRISKLVSSVKSYTHMDQAPEKESADIHVGIRNTLTMLQHKLKKNNITITEDFDTTLPLVDILVSEINQVWTNLIDNAIDAMEESEVKELHIETRREGSFVNIFISDTGKGISPEIVDKIFDPFYTTKPIGKGTGLGLDVVNQIMQHHKGAISVEAEHNITRFKVCIPLNS